MKLSGVKVVDLSVYLPGPYLTQTMADHGAEVMKIEPPGGDPARQTSKGDESASSFFGSLNRGKKSVVLDLKNAEDKQRLYDMVVDADVFVESFRPGVAARLGMDFETLAALNARLVYCSVSAFGQSGRYSSRPAHDLVVEALSGVASVTLDREGRPVIPGLAAADIMAALRGLNGILIALLRRVDTGRGDFIDIAMLDCLVAAIPNRFVPVLAGGQPPVAQDDRALGGAALNRLYETADRRFLALGGQEEKFARRLFEALGRPEFVEICRRPAGQQRPAIDFLTNLFLMRPLPDWTALLEPLDICFAPVNDLREVFEDPHLRDREMFLTTENGRHIATPIKFLLEPARPSARVPALNEGEPLVSRGILEA